MLGLFGHLPVLSPEERRGKIVRNAPKQRRFYDLHVKKALLLQYSNGNTVWIAVCWSFFAFNIKTSLWCVYVGKRCCKMPAVCSKKVKTYCHTLPLNFVAFHIRGCIGGYKFHFTYFAQVCPVKTPTWCSTSGFQLLSHDLEEDIDEIGQGLNLKKTKKKSPAMEVNQQHPTHKLC